MVRDRLGELNFEVVLSICILLVCCCQCAWVNYDDLPSPHFTWWRFEREAHEKIRNLFGRAFLSGLIIRTDIELRIVDFESFFHLVSRDLRGFGQCFERGCPRLEHPRVLTFLWRRAKNMVGVQFFVLSNYSPPEKLLPEICGQIVHYVVLQLVRQNDTVWAKL